MNVIKLVKKVSGNQVTGAAPTALHLSPKVRWSAVAEIEILAEGVSVSGKGGLGTFLHCSQHIANVSELEYDTLKLKICITWMEKRIS